MKPTQSPRLPRSQNNSVYNMSHAKRLPELPPLPASASAAPSELYQLVLKSNCYPPLMQQASWTLAAPFKEQSYYRSPSDSIANNYTPTARDLKLKNVHKLKTSSMTGTSLGSAEQKRASPPSKEFDPSRKKLKRTQRSQWDSDRSTPTLLNSLDPISLCALAHMPELRVIRYTDNQPLTPEEQYVVMHLHEKEISKREKPPSRNDIELITS